MTFTCICDFDGDKNVFYSNGNFDFFLKKKVFVHFIFLTVCGDHPNL